MDLKTYLQNLESCPPELLQQECGVYDNFPILLNTDFDKLVKYIEQTHSRTYERKISDADTTYCYKGAGLVECCLMSYVSPSIVSGLGCARDMEEKKHADRQSREFTISMTLHPYNQKQDKRTYLDNNHPVVLKEMARVLTELCEYFIKEKISVCLPDSIGEAHGNDYSRIVYHVS